MGEQSGELLTEAQVARMLAVSLSTMKRLRAAGEGPPAIKVGKRAIRYDREAVREWLRQRAEEGS